ncbi:MAG: phosphonate ABC transporter ATP-binding protein [Burkholderiales bacterium]
MEVNLSSVRLVLPGGQAALRDVDLQIAPGERLAIIGPSGAGKTSLLRVVGAAWRPTSGRVAIAGSNPWKISRGTLRRLRSRIGMIHQAPPLPPTQRVVTAVLAGRVGSWGAWKGVASLVYPIDMPGARRVLERLDLAERLFERCDRLSGGQLQRVGVARVLYQQPDLILADEPVSALDPQLADRTVGELVREAHARGATLLGSLHAVDLALRWFPRVVGLREGSISFDAPPLRVTDAMLRELYSSESPVIPTQDNRPLALPDPRPRASVRRPPPCR